MDKTNLGDRMKGYEAVPQNVLMKRMPVIIRVDGKSFHTFTKGMEKPVDPDMQASMESTAAYLTHFIQNAVFTYAQSDEISILLRDWSMFESQQWFGGKIQKIVSITAAMTSMAFYAAYEHHAQSIDYTAHRPIFDARVFNVPHEEVANYFVWRQKDAMRNSVNMMAQCIFSHKQLQGKKIPEVKDMLTEYGAPWEDTPLYQQRGFCVNASHPFSSFSGQVDRDIPIFTENREYVEKWLDGNYSGE